MRKFLLASVATFGTGDWRERRWRKPHQGRRAGASIGTSTDIRADRRTDPGTAGLAAAPSPLAYVNNNNNYQAPMLPGARQTQHRARSSSTSTARCRWTAGACGPALTITW